MAITDGKINEIAAETLGVWPSFHTQSWACRVVRAVTGSPESGVVDLSEIPHGWWLYGLFHNHTPIVYAKDRHHPCTSKGHGQEPWTCKLQRFEGGMLVVGHGETPLEAMRDAYRDVALMEEWN